jgi:hypothetical protein
VNAAYGLKLPCGYYAGRINAEPAALHSYASNSLSSSLKQRVLLIEISTVDHRESARAFGEQDESGCIVVPGLPSVPIRPMDFETLSWPKPAATLKKR